MSSSTSSTSASASSASALISKIRASPSIQSLSDFTIFHLLNLVKSYIPNEDARKALTALDLGPVLPIFAAAVAWIAKPGSTLTAPFAEALEMEIGRLTGSVSPALLRLLHGFHAILSSSPRFRDVKALIEDLYALRIRGAVVEDDSSSSSSSSEEELSSKAAKRKLYRKVVRAITNKQDDLSSSSDSDDDEKPKKRPAKKQKKVLVISDGSSSSSSSEEEQPVKKKHKPVAETKKEKEIKPWVPNAAHAVPIDKELFDDWLTEHPTLDREALQNALQDVACRVVALDHNQHLTLGTPRLLNYCKYLAPEFPAYGALVAALDDCDDIEEVYNAMNDAGALLADALPDIDAAEALWDERFGTTFAYGEDEAEESEDEDDE